MRASVRGNRHIQLTVDPMDLRIPNNLSNETLLLSPLLSYELKNNGLIKSNDGEAYSGELKFSIAFGDSTRPTLLLKYEMNGESSPAGVSEELRDELLRICEQPDFQRYVISALRKKRRDAKIDLFIRYRDGRINEQGTFVQT